MKKKRITVRLSESQMAQVESLIKRGSLKSVSDCVRVALDYWLHNKVS
jgi:Arc/MetJ-type ribon-helix-helix transcriptional regulator